MITKAAYRPVKSFRPVYKTRVTASAHFIVRWLERVHGINTEALRKHVTKTYTGAREATDGDIVTFLITTGITQQKMRKKALPSKVEEAFEYGATEVPYEGYVYVAENGRVKTILLGQSFA